MLTRLKDWFCLHKGDAAWLWLVLSLLVAPLTPEYISPFFLFIGFIILRMQFIKQKKKTLMGTIGKTEFVFMGYMLLTFLWSSNRLYSVAISFLWLGMFLIQLMMSNLCDSKAKFRVMLRCVSLSGATAGGIGLLQLFFRNIGKRDWMPDPLYRGLDTFVFDKLPIKMIQKNFQKRSSGPFDNPNLLATFLILAFVVSIYLFATCKNKKHRWMHFLATLCIAGGIASTQSRGAFLAIFLASVIMVCLCGKKNVKSVFSVSLVSLITVLPSILSRLSRLFAEASAKGAVTVVQSFTGDQSTSTHLNIWFCSFFHICTHLKVFFFGLGAGIENVWNVLLNTYNIKQPHAHNIFLELWMETGLIGLLLFIAVLVVFFVQMIRLFSRSESARMVSATLLSGMVAYLFFGMTDYLYNSPKQIQVFFVLLGLGQAAYAVFPKKSASKKDTPVKFDDLITELEPETPYIIS